MQTGNSTVFLLRVERFPLVRGVQEAETGRSCVQRAISAQLASSIPSIAEALAGTGTVCAGSKRQYYGFLATLGTRTRGIVINPP